VRVVQPREVEVLEQFLERGIVEIPFEA